MSDETSLIFDIEKFAVRDGPGIRTVVFMKGCPLHCLWCHNPESQSMDPEMLFYSGKCTRCGICAAVCPRSCHAVGAEGHRFDRSQCTVCGLCSERCPAEALHLVGRRMSVNEVMSEVMKDQIFYRNSGGGITLSGGEPLTHFAFTSALLKEAKEVGIHTAVETCGFSPWERIRELLPLVDLWLWDVKASPEKHEKLTGVPAEPILENLYKLDQAGSSIILRCPLVSGINDEDLDLTHIAALADKLSHVQQIDLEPYNPLGEKKNRALGRKYSFHSGFASESDKIRWKEVISSRTRITVHL